MDTTPVSRAPAGGVPAAAHPWWRRLWRQRWFIALRAFAVFTAMGCIAAESEPDPGSVSAKEAISPSASRGSHSAFCASVPPFLKAEQTIPVLIEIAAR